MVTSRNRIKQKICFIFITLSPHNRRYNSVDIMTRLDD